MAENLRPLRPRASSHEAVHILSDFRTGVIVFLFGGPDSGQNEEGAEAKGFREASIVSPTAQHEKRAAPVGASSAVRAGDPSTTLAVPRR